MEVIFRPEADEHLAFWKQSGNKKVMQKIKNLLESIVSTPYEGIGKPEPLKYNLTGCWSRRITEEHRLVYRLINNDTEVEILSLRFHY